MFSLCVGIKDIILRFYSCGEDNVSCVVAGVDGYVPHSLGGDADTVVAVGAVGKQSGYLPSAVCDNRQPRLYNVFDLQHRNRRPLEN